MSEKPKDHFSKELAVIYRLAFSWNLEAWDESAERFYEVFTDILEDVREHVEIKTRLADQGIGPYEFWGAPSFDSRIAPEIVNWTPKASVNCIISVRAKTVMELEEVINNVKESIDTGIKEYGRKDVDVEDSSKARCLDDIIVESYECQATITNFKIDDSFTWAFGVSFDLEWEIN